MIITKGFQLDDAQFLWNQKVCLSTVSKNVRGELTRLEYAQEKCDDHCRTLKTDHLLRLEVQSHQPCDSPVGTLLDGGLRVRRLVHALDTNGEGRGLHTGDFEWAGAGVRIRGRMSGLTNEGTHREPVFHDCQKCDSRGYMEGRLRGRIVRAKDERLVGCYVVAAYRLRFDPSQSFTDTGVEGTIEGLVVCPCAPADCVDFTAFPAGSHANPWMLGSTTFEVHDYTGALTTSAEVVTWGGYTGLNVAYETLVTFGAPVAEVDVTLVHTATPPTVTALDAAGAVLDSATMTVAGTPETLHLTGPGIDSLVITAPNDETLLLEVCTS